MTGLEKQSWGKVRTRGRDRFLLRSIARMGWGFILAGAVVEIIWWLFTRELPVPMMATIAKWCLAAVVGSAFLGWREWNEKENNFHELNEGEAGY